MKTLLLVQGISGSGKTTFAKEWVAIDPVHRVRINLDDIRNMLGKYWVPEREDLVQCIHKTSFHLAMAYHLDIVIDNYSNLNPVHIQEYTDMVNLWNEGRPEEIQYKIETKLINTPLKECIRRDSLRENPIGESVIKKQWKKYQSYIISNSINNIPILKQDPKLPHIIIADLDGTICYNTSGRPFFGPEAAKQVSQDKCVEPISDLIHRFCDSEILQSDLVVVTGRDESMREATEKWLDDNWLHPLLLLMRNNNDFRPGPEIKKEIFEKYIKDKYFVEFVLEDNNDCVKMWRDLGLTCLQPNDGNF